MSDAIGRRLSGFIIGIGGAVTMALAGYLHDAYIGTVSVFFLLVMAQRFFGDGSYAVIGPYLAEVWPNRLRGSGMGFGYGVGNLGKIIGPLGTRDYRRIIELRISKGDDGRDISIVPVPVVLVCAGCLRLPATRHRDQGPFNPGDRGYT